MWVGGMRMSTIATSGLCIATCRSRSSALSDWATTSKPDSPSSRTTPSRRRTESSAITTRHRVAEHRDRVAQRREVAREAVREQLMDVLGLGQPGQPVAAEVTHGDVRRGRVRVAESEDLPAVTGRADPGGAVDVDARVAVVGDERLSACARPSGPGRRGRRASRARSGPAGPSTAAAAASSASRTRRRARRRGRRSRSRRGSPPLRAGCAARRRGSSA